MEKELKIEVPQGYEIDRQKSTFDKIIFKKIPENPKTWEEYCERTKNNVSYFWSSPNSIIKSWFDGSYYEFVTEERVRQYVTLSKLLQLRDYWISNWKRNSRSLANTYLIYNEGVRNIVVAKIYSENFPLTFPTREMAEEFKNCFEDLIKEAYPLV